MHRSFSYTLLITWFLFVTSCHTTLIVSDFKTKNITISVDINAVESQLVSLYQPYKNILYKDMNRVISISETEMIKDKPESELTIFLAEHLIEEGKKEAVNSGFSFQPKISYFNYGGIRAAIPKGEITVGNIYELMPFENEMVFVQIDGSQVQQFLNAITAKCGDSAGGVRFTISSKQAKNVLVDGEKPDEDKKYWIVSNDYG